MQSPPGSNCIPSPFLVRQVGSSAGSEGKPEESLLRGAGRGPTSREQPPSPPHSVTAWVVKALLSREGLGCLTWLRPWPWLYWPAGVCGLVGLGMVHTASRGASTCYQASLPAAALQGGAFRPSRSTKRLGAPLVLVCQRRKAVCPPPATRARSPARPH